MPFLMTIEPVTGEDARKESGGAQRFGSGGTTMLVAPLTVVPLLVWVPPAPAAHLLGYDRIVSSACCRRAMPPRLQQSDSSALSDVLDELDRETAAYGALRAAERKTGLVVQALR